MYIYIYGIHEVLQNCDPEASTGLKPMRKEGSISVAPGMSQLCLHPRTAQESHGALRPCRGQAKAGSLKPEIIEPCQLAGDFGFRV